MRYILILFSIFSASLSATHPNEEEKVSSIIAKLQDYTESFEALMEDRLSRIVDIPLDYERRKSQDGPEAAISHYRALFGAPGLNEQTLFEFVRSDLPRMRNNLKIPEELKTKIESAQKYKTPKAQATFLFKYLMNQHHAYVAQHTEERVRGTVPCCDPAKFNEIKSPFDQVTVETALAVYRQNLYFLKKLYPFIDTAYLDDESRRILILDKHLRDILESRNREPDHPEAGFETFPHQHFIPKLFDKIVPQATDNTKEKELKRIRESLAKRPTILIYFKASPGLVNGEIQTNAEGHIDFETLSKIPPQDQLSKIIFQANQLIGKGSDSFFRKEYDEWYKQTKPKLPPQVVPQTRKTKKKRASAPQQQSQPADEMATSAVTSSAVCPLPAIEPKPIHVQAPTIRVEGHEKDREARRAAWEEKQAAEPAEKPFAETSVPKYEFSEATRNTLRSLFKIITSEALNWDDFVSTWKELRAVIDGVEDAKLITKSGSARKLEGGPIQKGRKQKARSFVIHEPHKSDGHTLGLKAQDRIAKLFEEKFGWTREKLRLD